MTGWVAVGLTTDFEPGTVAGTRIRGREIAVWRMADGKLRAMEDRCPHRGMRMSLGFVRGDRIGCLYHGWQYDGEGRCRAIPSHPDIDVPATIRIPLYPLVEAMGFVWIWPELDGTPSLAPPLDGAATAVRSVEIDAAEEVVAAALAKAALAEDCVTVVQPVAADRCAVHTALRGDRESIDPARLVDVARLLEQLRRDLAGATPAA